MAVVTIRALTNTDHSVLVNRNQFEGQPDNFMGSCCCGWRGNIWDERHIAYGEAAWHVDNHAADRITVAVH